MMKSRKGFRSNHKQNEIATLRVELRSLDSKSNVITTTLCGGLDCNQFPVDYCLSTSAGKLPMLPEHLSLPKYSAVHIDKAIGLGMLCTCYLGRL